jgi:hypothetical protein
MTTALVPANGTHFDTFDVSGTSVQLLWTDTTPTVVAKHLCEQFGLSWSRQAKVLKDPANEFNCGLTAMVGTDGKDREMLSLPVGDAARWVMQISPSRVGAEIRDRLIAFQRAFIPALIAHVEAHWRSITEEALWSLSRLRVEVIARKPLWTKIRDWMAESRSFEEIWRASNRSQRVIVEAIGDMERLGLITAKPLGCPGAARQLDMFSEG